MAYFWPTLDLFAPFPPERIDREYKSGIDAARLTVPLGGLSELDSVVAILGTDLSDDGSAGALLRWHLEPVDVGVMAGWFHGDTVGGGFATASLGGTGLRAEAAFTHSGDHGGARLNRETFIRITLGLDRQITSALSVMAEIASNGFGASHADRYPPPARPTGSAAAR